MIVVQHLDPHHASLLVELLGRVSAVPVQWAGDRDKIVSGRIYVGPAGHSLTVADGRIQLAEPVRRFPDGIDGFMRSVAEDFAHRAVAVILSGNGSDGAL